MYVCFIIQGDSHITYDVAKPYYKRLNIINTTDLIFVNTYIVEFINKMFLMKINKFY